MTVKEGFLLREVGTTKVIIAIGRAARSFHAIAHVNTSGAIIFTGLKNGESVESIAEKLCSMFRVDADRARSDVKMFADKLIEVGIMET